MLTKRSEAIAAGDDYYFTGKPCKHGHVAKRHVRTGCYECTKEIQKSYRERKAVSWAAKNAKWRQENKDRIAEIDAEYRKKNKTARKVQRLKYKTAKRARSVNTWNDEFDLLVFEEAQELCQLRAGETGFLWHIDHILPLRAKTVSGLHVAENIQVIPAVLNLLKGNKLMFTKRGSWLASRN